MLLTGKSVTQLAVEEEVIVSKEKLCLEMFRKRHQNLKREVYYCG